MTVWQASAPAKINLGLFVGPVRDDARHELVSVMQSISLADELTLGPAAEGTDADELCCPGVPALERDNLASRALALFRQATGWDAPPLSVAVEKRVPVAGGMGGGSGDAAAALRLAAQASGIGDEALLLELAAELGADVPAQVGPGRWLALGAGERLHPLPPPQRPFGVAVVPLAIELSTAAVYAQADRLGARRAGWELAELAEELGEALAGGEQLPPGDLLVNDLQAAAVSLCPAIEPALTEVRQAGADFALLSGSGPTVLGLFAGEEGPERAARAAAALAEPHPGSVPAVPVDRDFARPRRVRNNDENRSSGVTRPDRAPDRRTP